MKLDYRLIVLDGQILHVELGALRKHLSQFGEGAFDEGFLAGVLTGERVGAHHFPVNVVGNLLKEGRAVTVLESLEDFANALGCNDHFDFSFTSSAFAKSSRDSRTVTARP